jgi:hypothetical protein
MSTLTLEDVIVEAATQLALAGVCDVKENDAWGGVDLVPAGFRENVGGFANGVRIALLDNHVILYQFKSWNIAGQVELAGSAVTSSVLVAVVKGWI